MLRKKSDTPNVVDQCREQLADLFHVKNPNRIAFSSGATASLNLVLMGLPLEGRHVITTATDHNSVHRPLKRLALEGHITLDIAQCDGNGSVAPDTIAGHMQSNTVAVVVNPRSDVTGVTTDIAAVGRLTRERGIPFIVDASQSAGLMPIDVEAMHIDALAFTGHKFLYGLPGIGGAYIGPRAPVKPLLVGGTGIKSE